MAVMKTRSVEAYSLETAETIAKLRSVEAYSLEGVEPVIQTRRATAFVLTTSPRQVQSRTTQAWVMTADIKRPSFAVEATQQILSSINRENNRTWTFDHIGLGDPKSLADNPGFNSQLTVTAKAASGYSGTQTLNYNRFTIGSAWSGKDIASYTVTAGTTHGQLAAINAKFGLALTTRDVRNFTVKAGDTAIALVAADTSYYFVPGTEVVLGSGTPSRVAA